MRELKVVRNQTRKLGGDVLVRIDSMRLDRSIVSRENLPGYECLACAKANKSKFRHWYRTLVWGIVDLLKENRRS